MSHAVLGDFVSDDLNHANPYFISGQLASGYFAVGDIRDTAGAIYNGQGETAILNMMALIPLVGDAEKTVVRIDRAFASIPLTGYRF
jgi:hypothetical protein